MHASCRNCAAHSATKLVSVDVGSRLVHEGKAHPKVQDGQRGQVEIRTVKKHFFEEGQ